MVGFPSLFYRICFDEHAVKIVDVFLLVADHKEIFDYYRFVYILLTLHASLSWMVKPCKVSKRNSDVVISLRPTTP